MGQNSFGGNATERWDKLYTALSAEPRRMIIFRLMDEPEERRLSLPNAADPPNQSVDAETFRMHLRHQHLPMLAEAGYIRWEDDPFCVQRGPYFEEPAAILGRVIDPIDPLPKSLIQDCNVLQESYDKN